MTTESGDVTALLLKWSDGDKEALAELLPLVYDELRHIAKRYLDREDPRHTLQPTALVNEVYMRLVKPHRVQWKNRLHFYGFSAELMRRILVDHARGKLTEKRGGGARPISLEDLGELAEPQDVDLVAHDDALKSLAKEDARQSRIVEMRYFAGLTHEEIGELLGVTSRTVKREWRTARLWLYQEIRRG